jgi:hypothetical protein
MANHQISYPQHVFQSLPRISFSSLTVDKQPIGKGVFGKLQCNNVVSFINVCIKVFQSDEKLSVYPLEAVLPSSAIQTCHGYMG